MQRKLDYKWVVLLLVSIACFLAQGTRLIYSAVMGFLNDAFTPRVSMASLTVIAVVGVLAILYARLFTFKKDKI